MSRVKSLIAAALLGFTPELLAAQEETPRPRAWDVTVGAVTLVMPEYAGADEYRILPIPVAKISYRERLYLGPSTTGLGFGAGINMIRAGSLTVSGEVTVLDSRSPDRANALAGMNDQEMAIGAGLGLTWRAGAWTFGVGGAQGLNDGAGLIGTASLGYTKMFGRALLLTTSANLTAANQKQMRREFGVTPVEAARRQDLIDSGDGRLEADEGTVYRPSAGLRSVGPSMTAIVILSPKWSLLGFGGADFLLNEAKESPLVRRTTSVSGGLGIGYRF
jgi:outer membrane scaffolding protein for murein synthesis (MipA/OmpV family)